MEECKMSEIQKEIALIGIGNCGGQVCLYADKKYPEIFDTIYMNTSHSDLAMIDSSSLKLKIGRDAEVEGSGKNRSKMKQYLRDSIEKVLSNKDFLNLISEKKYVFIISSAAGGTGSGASPVLFEVLRQAFVDVHFILVTVLPKMQDSLSDQGNTLEFLSELYNDLGEDTTYMIYDNESTSEHSPTEALTLVNKNIVEDIRILSCVDNHPTPYESIDSADMESIITTPGRLLVARVNKGLTEKNMEDNAFDEMLIKAIKQSCQCETDRNKKVVRWGIITFFTEEVNKLYTGKFDKLIEFIGEPDERFNHNAISEVNEGSNFMYLIAAGLSPINDRATKIKNRVFELKSKLEKDGANKYVLSEDDVVNDALSIRKQDASRKQASDKAFKPKDVFAKFMK